MNNDITDYSQFKITLPQGSYEVIPTIIVNIVYNVDIYEVRFTI